MYKKIFLNNVLTALATRHMSKKDLAAKSGVSQSFLSIMASNKVNPSLKTMEAIAEALEIPLPTLLEPTDMVYASAPLPAGYERVTLILPEFQAFVAKSWAEDARKQVLESRL
ncbi:MAG: helix-turn-helix domain-containing protein [Rhodocyclaceae bacterium]|nr:helix-turn-helix domain-containing protein [Rhodocyclaceae bacterium]MBR4737288.1 helix-turn-helix domain-containing protein [Rhodocyclaceae bacterium]